MKKGIAIGALMVASLALLGCQQPKPQTQTPVNNVPQTETSTATIKINEAGQTSTSTATLEVMPNTQEKVSNETSTQTPVKENGSTTTDTSTTKTE